MINASAFALVIQSVLFIWFGVAIA